MKCQACGGLVTAHEEVRCVAELSMKIENLLVTVDGLRKQRDIGYDFIALVQTEVLRRCVFISPLGMAATSSNDADVLDDLSRQIANAMPTALKVDPTCLDTDKLQDQARQLVKWEASGRSGLKPDWLVLK